MEYTVVDVRGMIESGTDPFEHVVAAFDRLKAGEEFVLVTPFDPKPLVSFLSRRGAQTSLMQSTPGDVRYRISSTGERCARKSGDSRKNADGVLDLRGLEPPEPMVLILEAVDQAGPAQPVRAILSRMPGHLIQMLEQRGIPASIEERDEAYFLTVTKP